MRATIETTDPRSLRRRVARLARAVEAMLWLVGASTLAAAGWMVGDAVWYQHHAASVLTEEWRSAPAPVSVITPAGRPSDSIAAGTPLARLSIPRLGISAIVAEGVDREVLQHALGHVPGSARPGQNGNVALAGHRDTFFRSLGEVSRGDLIQLESAHGRDSYQVEWAAVVEPSQVVVTEDAGYPALTLVTCYPFHYIGDAPYRYVIRARRADGTPGGKSAGG